MHNTIAIASLALLSFLPLAASAQPGSPALRAVTQEEEKSPLAETMVVLKQGQRSLKKAIKDPSANKSAILETLAAMETSALRALALKPATPEGLSESESALLQVRFRIQMTGLYKNLLEMERATLKNEGEKLPDLYKALTADKKNGHQKFRED